MTQLSPRHEAMLENLAGLDRDAARDEALTVQRDIWLETELWLPLGEYLGEHMTLGPEWIEGLPPAAE